MEKEINVDYKFITRLFFSQELDRPDRVPLLLPPDPLLRGVLQPPPGQGRLRHARVRPEARGGAEEGGYGRGRGGGHHAGQAPEEEQGKRHLPQGRAGTAHGVRQASKKKLAVFREKMFLVEQKNRQKKFFIKKITVRQYYLK